MSFQAMAWAVKQEAGSISGKAILLMLANYADDKGHCFPGQDKLAQECECSIRTIRDWLDKLESIGLITRIERRRNDGYRTSDLIALNLENSPAVISPENNSPENDADITGNSRRFHRQNLPSNLLVEPLEETLDSTLPETSSDETRKGKKRISYPEAFEALWKAYPTSPNMSKKEAFDAWKKLDDDDRSSVLAAVPGYRDFLAKKPDLEIVHLCRFISKRRFDGFAPAQKQEATPKVATDDDWQKRLGFARQQRRWSVEAWGPMPHADGSFVPAALLQPDDGCGWSRI